MKTYSKYSLFIVLIITTISSYATHIVGGSLTYVHNGGSSYTVTLKLYRDCGPGTAGFPGNVNISVRGNNGSTFSTSKDFSMSLQSVTSLPSNLDPCAIPPTPMPCVEEGIYTKTVTNLPPNPGGYHLYYQIIARNLSIVNIDATCNCIGESFYSYIPGTSSVWLEDFSLANGTTVDNGATAWSVANGATAPQSANVNNNRFQFRGANNGEATWSSEVINISSFPGGVDLSVDLSENGNFENSDSLFVYYRLNGGPRTLFGTNGTMVNDFNNAFASHNGVIGNTVQIEVRVHYGGNSPTNERYRIDNVSVFNNLFIDNNSATFTLSPPLFLCQGQPFVYDHSALDPDGDSLVYSFYTPYDGDNGNGPLDPTFPGNTASFQPVLWEPGFSATNPLGGAPLNLDPSTGILSGTPPMLGQFVVGIKVQEFRNGVLIDETLRDFQINVVNCPQPNPPVAGSDIIINDGCTDTLSASGYIDSTVVWTSISPGNQGDYDSYLSCTNGCIDPIITQTGTPPAYVDYMICGTAASCNNAFVCDTVRVTFNPSLSVTINPQVPVICFGQTSTTLTANGNGGTPPYSYLWNNANPSQTNIVGAGTYTVELSDNTGCPPVFTTVVVTEFTNPTVVDAGVDDTVCIQNPIATLNATITGASGGTWSGGLGTYSPNNTTLSGMTYTPTTNEINNGFVDLVLTSSSNGGCPTESDTIRIYFLGFIGTPSFTQDNVSCYGLSDASATVNITGGIAPFTYLWNTVPTQTNATITGLSIGSYDVTITNGLGCQLQASTTITQPAPLSVSSSGINVTCPGYADGSLSASAFGGTTPYNYSWTPGGASTPTASNLSAGNYTVTVTDSNGCTASTSDTIFDPVAMTSNITPTNVSCNGGNDGTAYCQVTNGTPPYSYSWSPSGATSDNVMGLTAGTHVVTITDNNGCSILDSVIITEPSPILLNITSTDESCDYLDDGSATVTASGGTIGYNYLWANGGQTTPTINNLSAGTYPITVTDNNGCTASGFATINEPNPIVLTTSQTNISCSSGNDGSASVGVSGGTPGYIYSWNPGGATTPSINNLSAGTYTVDVSDLNNCTAQTSVTITEPIAPISSTATISDVTCAGGNDGSIQLLPVGGTGPFTYLWLPGGQTTQDISNLTAGSYSVTITDANGCTQTDTYVVGEPLPLSIVFGASNTSCFGGNDGSITANVSGGTPLYTYLWNNTGGNSSLELNLSAGYHSVTITDALGCSLTDSTEVIEPSPITISVTTTDETCDYLDNGTASASASGGIAGYTYTWAPGGQTGASISGLASGNYSVTATDNNGCTNSANYTINEPTTLTVNILSSTDVSCNGGADGNASAQGAGGTPNYTYLWSPGGGTNSTANNLTAGIYTVTITDDNGCQNQNNITINEPTPVSVTTSSTPASCFGISDGSVSANATGGTSPYTYTWQPGGMVGASQNNLPAGTYSVTATDANGCSNTSNVTITEPDEIILNAGAVNSNCGIANGMAYVSIISGGAAPFNYLWNPTASTNDTITGLFSGVYNVVVIDANGCTSTASGNVNDDAAPLLTISSSNDVSCNGGSDGSATVSLVGGLGPFTYSWSPIGGNSATATNLPTGTYTVSVDGSNGCGASIGVTISEPTALSSDVNTTPVSCFGGNDGTASVTTLGGTGAYTYLWMPSGTSGTSVTGLPAGLDSVQVTDDNGCSLITTFMIDQPTTSLSVNVTGSNINCWSGSDGTVQANASGGTPPYSYNWTGGLTNQSLSNLPIGNYSVTVTDANGCTATDDLTLSQPTPITLTPDSLAATCGLSNGMASVIAAGGVGNYTYSWSPTNNTTPVATGLPTGTYVVTVTDDNNCTATEDIFVDDTPGPTVSIISTSNVSCPGGADGTATAVAVGGTVPITYSWSPTGGTNATATGLGYGTYSVVAIDNNGCISNTAVSPLINQPAPLVNVVSTTDVNCNGGNDGAASVTTTGGTSGYTYLWMPGGANGTSITGLTFGTDSVQVTDNNGCTATTTFDINEPTALNSTITSTAVNCFGGNDGTATVSPSGGTPNYTYNWTPSGGSSATASGLSQGNYTVLVSDQNGCSTTNNIQITEPANALSASTTVTPNGCFGGANGAAAITPSGGTPGYSYSWTPGGGTNQIETGLSAGTYSVQVSDFNNCQTSVSLVITQPPALSGSLDVLHPTCGLSNGSITALISGGTPPYSYDWGSGITTSNITGLAPGTYSVTITDFEGCTQTLSTTINNIAGPTASIIASTSPSCFAGNNGTATIQGAGGTAPYNYNWLPYGGNSAIGNSLIAGTYYGVITDSNGCTAIDSVTITDPQQITINVDSIRNISCRGLNDGYIEITVNGGTPGYNYTWNPGVSNTDTVGNLPPGIHSVIVTDQNNCQAGTSVTITEPDLLVTSIDSIIHPTCNSSTDGTIYTSTVGGILPYTYLWSNTQTGINAQNLTGGLYSITVTDANGCTATNNGTINQPAPIITTVSDDDTLCLGSQGSLFASATGGNGNYSYTWQPIGVTNSGALSDSPLVTTNYTVMAFDANGCPGSLDNSYMVVNALDASNLEAFVTVPSICPGQSTQIYAQSNGVFDSLTYTWNNALGTGLGPFTVSPSQPTNYVVTATNSCGASVTDTAVVVFNPPPTLIISSDEDSACAPGYISFYDSSLTGNSADQIHYWEWDFGDGTTSQLQDPEHEFELPGTYYVNLTITTGNGCTSDNTNSPFIVHIFDHPTAAFTVNSTMLELPIDELICNNQSVGATDYEWNFGDGTISTDESPQHLYSSIGDFHVQMIAYNEFGCADTAYTDVTTHADFIFPNAFTPSIDNTSGGYYDVNSLDNDNFFPYTSGVEEYELRIFNRWGELIFESFDINKGWDGFYHGKLAPQGVYAWKAYARLNNGAVYNKIGNVTLLR